MPEFTGKLITPRLSSAPSSPVPGQMYYDTTANKLYWWNGTTWVEATGSGGGAGSTFASAVAKASTTAGGGSVNVALGWVALPLPPLTSEPSDAFTVSGNSVTVKDAGWYHVAATMFNGSAATNLFISLSTNPTAGDGDIANNGSGGIVYNRVGCDGSVKLAAGAKVYVYGWSNSASPVSCICLNFSIERIGGPKGDKGDTGGNATVPMDPWHVIGAAGEPGFTYGWVNYGTGDPNQVSARFRKDPLGKVHLSGIIANGTINQPAFYLPAGYWPGGWVRFAAPNSVGAGAFVQVGPDGAVTLISIGGAGTWIDLTGTEFDTGTVTAMPTGPQGPKGDTGGNATVPMDPWHTVGAAGEPAFTNAWTSSGVLQFRKDPLGRIWIRGSCATGATGTSVFTLPGGYRPKVTLITHSLQDNDVAGTWVYVNTDGTVVPARNQTTCFIDLSFDTETVTQMPTGPQGPAGPGVRGLVTSLPASAAEGDECYFQNAAMKALGIVWHFRYDATAPSGKPPWLFLGGAPWEVDTGLDLTAAAGATVVSGAAIVLPLGGDYSLEHGGRHYNNAAPGYGNCSSWLRQVRGAATIADNIAQCDFWTALSPAIGISITPQLMRAARANGTVAGDDIRCVAASSAGVGGIVDARWLKVTPIRVG